MFLYISVVISRPEQWFTSPVVNQPTILLTSTSTPFPQFARTAAGGVGANIIGPVWGQQQYIIPQQVHPHPHAQLFTESEINAMPIFMNRRPLTLPLQTTRESNKHYIS